jgi:SAM-dependent methyltransferase
MTQAIALEAPTLSGRPGAGNGYGKAAPGADQIATETRPMNSSRIWLQRELEAFAESLNPNSLVLDAGAGDQIYRAVFVRHRYQAADFEKVDKPYAQSTYVCDLVNIPVEDGRFDAVVLSQVMEHLPEPAAVLAELNRVLKPGGRFFYSAPLYYEEHEIPYDFYRYTQYGVKHLLQKAGFTITEFRWLEGYMGTVTHQLRMIARRTPFSPVKLGGGAYGWALAAIMLFLKPLLLLTAMIAKECDSRTRYVGSGHPINYLAIATKRN